MVRTLLSTVEGLKTSLRTPSLPGHDKSEHINARTMSDNEEENEMAVEEEVTAEVSGLFLVLAMAVEIDRFIYIYEARD